jgi:BirA family biotin operon repressor/biotin-[acetyl-CoA-carboxylase] ligase
LALIVKSLIEAPIIELDVIDSTNNYAMNLIDADMAQVGMTIVANSQTGGKGQRGNKWLDDGRDCILMSIICPVNQSLQQQFVYNATIANAIIRVFTSMDADWRVNIKWPNDIIINDKKAGGVLIENIIRGHSWQYAIIGIGINLNNNIDPHLLPYATSLAMQLKHKLDKATIINELREHIFNALVKDTDARSILAEYNAHLYKRGQMQEFSKGNESWFALVSSVNEDGTLRVKLENNLYENYVHGALQWVWR